MRQAVRDARLAVLDVQPMTEVVSASLQLERISSLVMVFFAIAAVVMRGLEAVREAVRPWTDASDILTDFVSAAQGARAWWPSSAPGWASRRRCCWIVQTTPSIRWWCTAASRPRPAR